MDMISFKEEVLRLIAFRQEGEYWDFKKEWHKNKSDLLHDIICMANNLSNHDGLIIIGVNEETDYAPPVLFQMGTSNHNHLPVFMRILTV